MSEYQTPNRTPEGFARVLLTGVSTLAMTLCAVQGAQAQGERRPQAPTQLQAPAEQLDPVLTRQPVSGTGSAGQVQLPPAAGALMGDPVFPTEGADTLATSSQYSDLENRLMRQAGFWEQRFNSEASIEVLEKVVSINPRNAEALFHLGRHEAQRGKADKAREYLNRLRTMRSDARLIARLESTIRLYQNQGRMIDEARRLAREGQTQAAIQQYQSIFPDGEYPDANLRMEVLHTMAGDERYWEEAVTGLRREILDDPENLRAKYTLAEILTYNEETRREGLDRLRRFAGDREFAKRAVTAYRNGLLWMNASLDDKPRYEEYLTTFPQDAEMKAKFLRLAKPPILANATALVNEAYRALYNDEIEKAETDFRKALLENPEDADALAGIGIVFLRQEKFADAETAFSRAVALDPKIRERVGSSWEAAAFWRRYHVARKATEAGDYDRSIAVLNEIRTSEIEGAEWADVALADTYLKMGKVAEAERLYNQILVEDDDNAPALMGLINIARERGQVAEAVALSQRLDVADRSSMGLGGLEAQIMRMRAETALKNGNLRVARRELEGAVKRAPEDPWLRLDYAALLRRVGERSQANSQMSSLLKDYPDSVEAKKAAAIYYSRIGNSSRTRELLAQIPSDQLDSGLRNLLAEAQFNAAIAGVRANIRQGKLRNARTTLARLEKAYAANPEKSMIIADGYAQAKDDGSAIRIIRKNLKKSKRISTGMMLRAADILGNNGDVDTARRIMVDLSKRAGSKKAKAELARLNRVNALANSRRLMKERQYVEAFETIVPILEANPRDGETLRLAGEIHFFAKKPGIAYEYFARAIEIDPTDSFSINGAVGAALELEDVDAASRLLEAALARRPNDPSLYYLAADVAQAAGNKRGALQALETARRLDQAQDSETGQLPAFGNRTPGLAGPRGFQRDSALQPAATGWQAAMERRMAQAGFSGSIVQTAAEMDDNPFVAVNLRGAGTDVESSGMEGSFQMAQANTESDAERTRRMLRGISSDPLNNVEPTGRVIPLESDPLPTSTGARFDIPKPVPVETRIEDLRWETDPVFQQDLMVRRRQGEIGLSKLTEVATHIRGETNLLNGRAWFEVTPTVVTAGEEATGRSAYRRFGSNALDPLLFDETITDPAVIAEQQGAAGVGFQVGYEKGRFAADLGVTPVGFAVNSLIGGIRYDFEFSEEWYLRVEGNRRAVKDSVLSYSGEDDNGNKDITGTYNPATQVALSTLDPSQAASNVMLPTGSSFGGVTRSGLGATVFRDFEGTGLYFGGKFEVFKGENVKSNDYFEFTGGFYLTPIREENERLQVGFNTTYFGFSDNQNFFTFGHGGYFSPQSFVSASVPVEWTKREGNLRYRLHGALGVQYFEEDGEDFFLDRPDLQSALEFLVGQATDPAFANQPTSYSGDDEIEVAYRIGGDVIYRMNERLELGASALFDDTAGYTEATGRIFFRYRFGGGLEE